MKTGMMFEARNRPWLLLMAVSVCVALYSIYWFHQLQHFKTEMADLQSGQSKILSISSSQVEYSGFPYRLEAAFQNTTLTRKRPDYDVTLISKTLTILRQPWHPNLFLMFADTPALEAVVHGARPLHVRATAKALEASLHFEQGHVKRLSLVFKSLQLPGGGWFADSVAAETFEVHSREVMQAQSLNQTSATGPVFADMVISGSGLKLGESQAATLSANLSFTNAPAVSGGFAYLDAWMKAGGTIDLKNLALESPNFNVQGSGTGSLNPTGVPLFSGTFETNRPNAIRTVLAGQPASADIPAKTKVRLALHVQDTQLYEGDKPLRRMELQLGNSQ